MTGMNGLIRPRKSSVNAPRAQPVVLKSGSGLPSPQFKHQLLRHNGSTTGSEERDTSRTSASQDQHLSTPHSTSTHPTHSTLSSSCSKNLTQHSELPESLWTITLKCMRTQSSETGVRSKSNHLPTSQKLSASAIALNGENHTKFSMDCIHF